MNDKNELLNDLLHEAAPDEFRAALLAETLGQVRRRKTERRRNRLVLSVACLIAVSIAFWRTTLPEIPPFTVQAPVVDPLIIHSQPLTPAMIVATNPQSVENVRTIPGTVAMIETSPGERLFKTINDDELLTLLAGRPAVLIRQSPGEAELHFLNPEDSNELFLP